MLLNLEVDGFRSLVRFKLDFRPGLNLLVGPNGSGKTNIISFLGFIAEFGKSDLSNIVSNLGGSGAVFRKLGKNRYQSKIRGTVRGKVKPDYSFRTSAKDSGEQPDNRTLCFEYAFTIQLSDDRESVFFARQSIRFQLFEGDSNLQDIKTWETDVEIIGNADGTVQCTNSKLAPVHEKHLTSIYRRDKEVSIEQVMERLFSSRSSLILFLGILLPNEFGVAIVKDFAQRTIFNPHPSRIRLAEDSAKKPGIRPDGSGLYSSLFALTRGKFRPDARYPFYWVGAVDEIPFAPRIKLDRLLDFFRLAYPSMVSLTVSNDQFENTIRARITLEGRAKSQIPLAALSDGTLKWMAFVTAIFTNENILAIEEPENFVHPFVQREAVRLVRDQLKPDSYMFMSSHSETILNSAEPEEIIVVSSRGSRTVARRVRNPSHLRKLINDSGFGLGFYYLSGALEDA
jgi:predicted ATPase